MNSTSKRNIGIAVFVVVVIIAAGVVFGPGLAKSFGGCTATIPTSIAQQSIYGSPGLQINGCSASYLNNSVSSVGTAFNVTYSSASDSFPGVIGVAASANGTAKMNQYNNNTIAAMQSYYNMDSKYLNSSPNAQCGGNSLCIQAHQADANLELGMQQIARNAVAYNNALKNTAIQQQTGATPPTLKIGTYNCTGGCATTIVYNQSNLLNTGIGVVAVAQPLSDLVNVTVNGKMWFSGVQGMQGIGTDYLPQNFGTYTFVATDQATGSTSSATVVFNPSPATTTVNANPGGPIQPAQPQQPQQLQPTTKPNVGLLQGIWDWIMKVLNQEV